MSLWHHNKLEQKPLVSQDSTLAADADVNNVLCSNRIHIQYYCVISTWVLVPSYKLKALIEQKTNHPQGRGDVQQMTPNLNWYTSSSLDLQPSADVNFLASTITQANSLK